MTKGSTIAPLKLLSCMSKMILSLHLMLVHLLPYCFFLMSAVFHSIDCSSVSHCLKHWFGISSTTLNLLSSGLSDRSQTAKTPVSKSQPVLLEYSIRQGNVLGPLLYLLYMIEFPANISKYPGLHCHFYDDTQIYLPISPELTSYAFSSIESCIEDVFSWMI